jgi:hypothetical protein
MEMNLLRETQLQSPGTLMLANVFFGPNASQNVPELHQKWNNATAIVIVHGAGVVGQSTYGVVSLLELGSS